MLSNSGDCTFHVVQIAIMFVNSTDSLSFSLSCSMDGYANTGPPPPPPAPLIPSAQTAFASPPGGPMSPGPMAGAGGYAPPPPPVSGAYAAPPPPGPPPPPLPAGASHITTHKMSSATAEAAVVNDARSDLLAAIRMGKSCSVCVCVPIKMFHINAYVCSFILQTTYNRRQLYNATVM